MRAPALPAGEAERLRALHEYQILDTPEEAVYDGMAALARLVAGTQMSAIALIDAERQWFKARTGYALDETPREVSFCSHVVLEGRPLVVEDASKDPRFAANPLVTGPPHIRFYAGMPLTNPEGLTLGTLCVFDPSPRQASEEQLNELRALARVVIEVLEGRRRFLTLFDAARIDVFSVEPVNQTILFASRGACARLGYSIKDLIGMPIESVAPALAHDGLRDLVSLARDGHDVVRESELRRRDRSTYPVELRVSIGQDRGDERVLVIAVDVTLRRTAQREINLLLDAINAAGDAIVVYALTGHGVLELSYLNDAFVTRSGYSRAEAIGKPVDYFRQGMPDDEGMRVIREAVANGEPVQTEVVSYRKDGSTYWNQVTMQPVRSPDGAITHWISIERDVTEDVARTSTLEEEHDRLLGLTRAARRLFTALDARALVSTLRDVVAQLLGADTLVYAVKESGVAVQVEELGSATWESGVRSDLIGEAVATRGRVLDADEHRAAAYAGRFADADYVVEIGLRSPRPLRSADLFVFDLITEYFSVAARNVSLYQELDERRSAVLELNQTKSDLIAMLAHDFRGPLTSIVGFADLTSEVGDVNEEQHDFLETIKNSAMQLSELATDTLTLSRLERNEVSLQIAPIDLAELLRNVIARQAERRQVEFVVEGDARVSGDDDRLRQVFANLVDNAIKYTPDERPAPIVTLLGRSDDVVVTVRDHGIGIPHGELSRVFDRFTRASNARRLRISGTGFGLYLTKQLVQLHGGTIAVESEEGVGSTFTVTLPRRVDRRSVPQTLVLLDPDRDRSFLGYGLQEAGYRVVTVATPEEIFATADAQPISVVIINVPEGLPADGVMQLRAFSTKSKIPIVSIANEPARRLNAAVTLMRPVLIGDVLAALDRLLND
jgi:PAS domain S-box-containing protein